MDQLLKIAIIAVTLLAMGATSIVLLRYKYVPQPQGEIASHILRIDRLNGNTCFIPLNRYLVEQLPAAGYTYQQCDTPNPQALAADSVVNEKIEGHTQTDELLRELEKVANQRGKEQKY